MQKSNKNGVQYQISMLRIRISLVTSRSPSHPSNPHPPHSSALSSFRLGVKLDPITRFSPGLLVAYPKSIEKNRSDFLRRRRREVNACCRVEQRGKKLEAEICFSCDAHGSLFLSLSLSLL
jgi:hypothetical protein